MSYDPSRAFAYPSGGVQPGHLGGWPGAPNFASDTSSPVMPATSPFAGAGAYGSSFDTSAPSLFSSTGVTKRPVDLFGTAALPAASHTPQDFLSSVNVAGPTSAPTGQHKADYNGMPSLPPVATGTRVDLLPASVTPNNYHHPEAIPSELRSRLLSLTASPTPVTVETLKTVRPVDLPLSDYRRDIMSADRHSFAYISHLRNVGNAVRVWRRTDKSPESGNPYANATAFMLKEFINNPTDIHITTSAQDETMVAIGDSTGNVSVHVLPVTPKDPTGSPANTKYCVLRITPAENAAPVRVLRVAWHPILPQVLAVAYSDGIVSVWNIAQVLADYHSRPAGQSSLADLIVSPPNTYPVTYLRPNAARAPLVINMSHGSETVTDVCLWGNTVFSATAYGHVYMHELATGNVQRIFRVHQHGVGALVLATCPAVDSGYMPLIATTSGDGSEVKLWRHASHLADWTCLQSLSLPVQSTPYVLSRYVFDDTFLIYNPVAGTAWELKLFMEESALLPGNFFAPLQSHALLLIATSNVIIQYTKDALTITSYPPPATYSKANLTNGPAVVVQPVQSSSSATLVQTAPQPTTEYHQHQRENSFSSNNTHAPLMQTQVPPVAAAGHQAHHHAQQQVGAPARVASLSGALPAANGNGNDSPLPKLPPRPSSQGSDVAPVGSRTPMKPVVSKPAVASNMTAIQAVQALLEESSRNLGEMISAEEERWKAEDKKFLLKVNEAMRHIPNAIAERIRLEIDKIPTYAVDVPELTRAIADSLAAPVGSAFREQFADVLIPGMEDSTAQMLRKVDGKLKSVAHQHAQTIAQNDVAKSVEPLVSTLMAATAEMTKSLNSLKPLQFPGAAAASAQPVAQTAQIAVSAATASTASTPSKKTAPAASASTPSQQTQKGKKDKKDASAANGAEKTILRKEPAAAVSTAAKSQGTAQSASAASKPAADHPSWYWLFALSHNVQL